MKHKTELKIGATGLVVIALLIFGINYMKGKNLFSSDKTYYAIFNTVAGIHESNYIYINGMKIGYIKKIKSMDAQSQKFLITLSINTDVVIPKDSKLVMYSSGLLGTTELRVDIGKSPTMLAKNDTILAGVESGLVNSIGSAIMQLDSVLININQVLNAETQKNIEKSFENIKLTTDRLSSISLQVDGLVESEKGKIKHILSNAESIVANLNNNNEKLGNIIANFNNISDTLAQAKIGTTLREANSSLASLSSVLNKIDKGEGSVGLLLSDDKLYNNLESSAKKLDALIEDIKQNPKRYLKFSIF
jgi:phospholipid/cholesterol/gamma-HCH transport system substrate-binding protein